MLEAHETDKYGQLVKRRYCYWHLLPCFPVSPHVILSSTLCFYVWWGVQKRKKISFTANEDCLRSVTVSASYSPRNLRSLKVYTSYYPCKLDPVRFCTYYPRKLDFAKVCTSYFCTSQRDSVYNPFSRAIWSLLCNKLVLHFLMLSIFMYQVPANLYGNTTFTYGRFTENVVLQCHFANRNHRLRSYFWGGTYLYSLFRAEGLVLSTCWE